MSKMAEERQHFIRYLRKQQGMFTPTSPLQQGAGWPSPCCGALDSPPQFFSRLPENGGAQRHRFWHTLLYNVFAYVVKIWDPAHARSGHQGKSSDLTSQKVWRLVKATLTERLPWNFQRLISISVSIKRISRNFDTGDLSSILPPLHYKPMG